MGKVYILEIVIKEGSDEFWEEMAGKTGCDEVVQAVELALGENGFIPPDTKVYLKSYIMDA